MSSSFKKKILCFVLLLQAIFIGILCYRRYNKEVPTITNETVAGVAEITPELLRTQMGLPSRKEAIEALRKRFIAYERTLTHCKDDFEDLKAQYQNLKIHASDETLGDAHTALIDNWQRKKTYIEKRINWANQELGADLFPELKKSIFDQYDTFLATAVIAMIKQTLEQEAKTKTGFNEAVKATLTKKKFIQTLETIITTQSQVLADQMKSTTSEQQPLSNEQKNLKYCQDKLIPTLKDVLKCNGGMMSWLSDVLNRTQTDDAGAHMLQKVRGYASIDQLNYLIGAGQQYFEDIIADYHWYSALKAADNNKEEENKSCWKVTKGNQLYHILLANDSKRAGWTISEETKKLIQVSTTIYLDQEPAALTKAMFMELQPNQYKQHPWVALHINYLNEQHKSDPTQFSSDPTRKENWLGYAVSVSNEIAHFVSKINKANKDNDKVSKIKIEYLHPVPAEDEATDQDQPWYKRWQHSAGKRTDAENKILAQIEENVTSLSTMDGEALKSFIVERMLLEQHEANHPYASWFAGGFKKAVIPTENKWQTQIKQAPNDSLFVVPATEFYGVRGLKQWMEDNNFKIENKTEPSSPNTEDYPAYLWSALLGGAQAEA